MNTAQIYSLSEISNITNQINSTAVSPLSTFMTSPTNLAPLDRKYGFFLYDVSYEWLSVVGVVVGVGVGVAVSWITRPKVEGGRSTIDARYGLVKNCLSK